MRGQVRSKHASPPGLALRAHGRGKAVKIDQFLKVPSARFGEHRVFAALGVPIEGLVDACLRGRPPHVHVVPTGRGAPDALVALVKHHFDAGVPAQRGVED